MKANLIRKIIPILIIAILVTTGCQKDTDLLTPDLQPAYELSATVNLTPGSKTQYYDIYVSNDRYAPLNNWLWVRRVETWEVIKYKPFTFSFNAPTVCSVSVHANQKVYGASRETSYGNITLEMDYTSIGIK
ncbi:MAG TPA: hypothetical protein VMY77_00625 [Chitinophagaceae bacterium]|nr:hypothetical protein [Chitinophagaceae bacterium]